MDNWLKRFKKFIACNETVKSYNFIVKKLKTAPVKHMFQEKKVQQKRKPRLWLTVRINGVFHVRFPQRMRSNFPVLVKLQSVILFIYTS